MSAGRRCKALAFGACLTVLGLGTASAGVDTIRAENNSVWLAAGAAHIDFAETTDDGTNVDSEFGWLPALSTGVSVLGGSGGYMASRLPRNLYLALDANIAFGDLRYDGGELLSGQPVTTTTDETIWSVRGRAGYAFQLGGSAVLIPYAQIGYRRWDRDPNNNTTQKNEYRSVDLMGGVLAQISPTPKTVFSLWAAAGQTVDAEVTSTLGSSKLHFDQDNDVVWTVGAKAGYWLAPHVELFTRAVYDRLELGISQDVFDPGFGLFFYEPESRTDTFTTQIGIAFNF